MFNLTFQGFRKRAALIYLCMNLFSCTGSYLRHSGSLVSACGLFFCFFFLMFNVYLFGCIQPQLQYAGSSSLTRDQTWAPCIGNMES